MTADKTDILKFMITLLTIINPLGAIPIFLSLTDNFSQQHIVTVSKTCSIAVIVTLCISLIFGQNILNMFGISIPSFTIGGGILLLSMAFSMITASPSKTKINKSEMETFENRPDLGIVPLAIPMLAGPGSISTAIIQGKSLSGLEQWLGSILVIISMGLIVYIVLRSSRTLGRKLGMVGMSVLSRVFGIILLAISIEMIAKGVKEILPILKGAPV